LIFVVLRLILAAVLVVAAVLKLAAPAGRGALATFGVRDPRVQRLAWPALGAVELALAIGVGLGSDVAAYAAAGLLGAFALGLVAALRAGRAGAPCGCFGARSTVNVGALVRTVVLAVGCAALPSLPAPALSTDEWLGLGLGVALVGVVALGVAVLALARELGALRMTIVPQAALEIPHEGPELGARTSLIERFAPGADAVLALAVFTSEGCRMCQALAPAIASLARDPFVALELFDEVRDADAWRALDVPGSPFAVALGRDGAVLAKGTFNTLAQLEGVLATAERRQAAGARA